jgi:hypothetical protein
MCESALTHPPVGGPGDLSARPTARGGGTPHAPPCPPPHSPIARPRSGAPALYDLVINVTEPSTGNTDAVGSYFGMRTVSLLPYTTPPTPGTGPRVGWDNPGGDLPGSPFVLPQADYNLCWAACNKTEGCNGWSYGVPNCGGDGASPQCWLKSSPGGWGQESCRVAGDQPSPGGPGMRPAVNGQFSQHLAGWLDQSWWPDGLVRARWRALDAVAAGEDRLRWRCVGSGAATSTAARAPPLTSLPPARPHPAPNPTPPPPPLPSPAVHRADGRRARV